MTKDETNPIIRDRVFGDRPIHVHDCSKGHEWKCNSPYCDSRLADCFEHGGQEPVLVGHEFWKGR